jgi:cyclophilin family peptidyl-prolyl cis-trans isomerase
MKKRAFPKAVKEAIEKGLERKEAPRNIERIIEKVAKTNEPNYILRRTIAKRLARGGIVQYKVDTDKGTIIYENADEKDANAILGMPTPTGEVIPLQIKVIR